MSHKDQLLINHINGGFGYSLNDSPDLIKKLNKYYNKATAILDAIEESNKYILLSVEPISGEGVVFGFSPNKKNEHGNYAASVFLHACFNHEDIEGNTIYLVQTFSSYMPSSTMYSYEKYKIFNNALNACYKDLQIKGKINTC